MTTGAYPSTNGYRTLRLPLDRHEYDDFLSEKACAKARLEEVYGQSPELFITANAVRPSGSMASAMPSSGWKTLSFRGR